MRATPLQILGLVAGVVGLKTPTVETLGLVQMVSWYCSGSVARRVPCPTCVSMEPSRAAQVSQQTSAAGLEPILLPELTTRASRVPLERI